MMIRMVLGMAVLCASATAQTSALAFEVTSVKPASPAPGQGFLPKCESGRFASIAPLYAVMNWAFGLNSSELRDLFYALPEWGRGAANSYEIQAVASESTSDSECREMVKTLLAERFKLATHWEGAEGRVPHLVVGRGGAKLQRVTESDQSPGFNITQNGRPLQAAVGSPVVRGMTMTELAEWISTKISNAPVFDKTGLDGMYKITLRFSAAHRTEFGDPDLPEAIEEQLGLKLEERKGSVRRLIVDHVEKPDSN